ncbi:hypothetical protein [Nannocystis pusilla]|uniref:hypothetical protein n=1 Tax=Nannocystis pusilla TaxID=889268 RepID=UPI003B7B67CF
MLARHRQDHGWAPAEASFCLVDVALDHARQLAAQPWVGVPKVGDVQFDVEVVGRRRCALRPGRVLARGGFHFRSYLPHPLLILGSFVVQWTIPRAAARLACRSTTPRAQVEERRACRCEPHASAADSQQPDWDRPRDLCARDHVVGADLELKFHPPRQATRTKTRSLTIHDDGGVGTYSASTSGTVNSSFRLKRGRKSFLP